MDKEQKIIIIEILAIVIAFLILMIINTTLVDGSDYKDITFEAVNRGYRQGYDTAIEESIYACVHQSENLTECQEQLTLQGIEKHIWVYPQVQK
jgi:hypothetical protein